MKHFWLLLLGGLVTACHGDGNVKWLAIKPAVEQDNKQAFRRKLQPATTCPLDTVALLTNARLDSLLTEASHQELREYRSTEHIPAHVLRYLHCVAGGDFSMADPGMMWNNSCMHEDGLADRQLAYLGVGPTITVITYYTGGIGVAKHVIIVKSRRNNVADFWKGGIDYEAATQSQIINSLIAQQHQLETLRRIAFTQKYILPKSDTTINAYEKSSFINFYLNI